MCYKFIKIIQISYKPSTYSNFFFNLTHMFCYLGKQFYGQAYPTEQPRKKKIVAAWFNKCMNIDGFFQGII